MNGSRRVYAALLRATALALIFAMLAALVTVWIRDDGAGRVGPDAPAVAPPNLPEARAEAASAPAAPPLLASVGTSIEGRVLTESGKPVPGAWVCLLPEGERVLTEGVAHARTSDDGSFSFAGLSAGRWLPRVLADGASMLPHAELVLAEARSLSDVRLVVAMPDERLAQAIRRARDAAADFLARDDHAGSVWPAMSDEPLGRDGLPVAARHVDLFTFGAADAARAVDVGGAHEVNAGAERNHIAWPASASAGIPVQTVLGTRAEVQVGAGETVVLDMVAPRRASVHGRVTADGLPVAGAVVQHKRIVPHSFCWTCSNLGGGPSGESVTTDSDGRFEQSLPYGDDVSLWAEAPDGGRGDEVHVSLSSGIDFEVELFTPRRRP